jgi:ATP-dependent Clp protease protease subunit
MSKKISKEDLDRFFAYQVHLPTRTIYLGSEVDHATAEQMIKSLHILDMASHSPINILMNNIGGDFFHGMAIYDAIRNCESHITIQVFGHAMSMAALLLQAADERILSPNSKLMIHYGDVGVGGNAKNAQRWSEEYKKCDQFMENVLLEKIQNKHPTFSLQKVQKMLEFDTFISANKALQLGLVDKILTPKKK